MVIYSRMKNLQVLLSTFVAVTFLSRTSECYEKEVYSLLMPNVKPNVPELYLCTPVKIDSSESYYIVGFEPNAKMDTAHHMLVYGCAKPGLPDAVWNCGEMAVNNDATRNNAGPCSQGSEIIYAWARDAPTLNLPEEVGFKIGRDTPIQYLVLQVHYAHIEKFKDEKLRDNSGVFLHYTKQELHKRAGVILLGTGGFIPALSTEYMETACNITEDKTIIPFAYRTHTHSLGKVVSGYVIKNNQWIRLGKRDPLTPQMFYKIKKTIPISKGDTLAARCTMENTRDRVTRIGSTNNDEMCNFYLMYYVEKGNPLDTKYCFTEGPPEYNWRNAGLINIPDRDASSL